MSTEPTGDLLHGPDGAAIDSAGNLYIANWDGGKGTTVVRVPARGAPHVFADGLRAPDGLAFGPDGRLYVSNFADGTVSRLDADGSHSVFTSGLGHPAGLAFDASGDLYVADFGNFDGSVVWRVTPDGRASIFARGFEAPLGLAFAASGDLFVSNFGSGVVHRVKADGEVLRFANVPNSPRAMLQFLAFDTDGTLYVPSYGHHRIYRFDTDGRVEVAAGGDSAGSTDGSPQDARFDGPNSIVRASDGTLWITEYNANRLRRLRLPKVARLDSIFRSVIAPGAPGCAVGVYQAGSTLVARGYGMADLERGSPITPTTPLWIASVSKQFTAATALLFADERRLSLDADLREWVPELQEFPVMSLRQALQHTAGLPDFFTLWSAEERPWSQTLAEADILRLLAVSGPDYTPGTEWKYSNSGYVLAARAIARAAGRPFRDAVAAAVFAPLGMRQSQVIDSPDVVVDALARGYIHLPDGWLPWRPRYAFAGSTGVVTTVEDFGHWVAALDRGSLGQSDLLRRLSEPGRLTSGKSTDYGSGLELLRLRGSPVVGHGGQDGGARSQFYMVPSRRLAIAVFCNRMDLDVAALARATLDEYW